MRWTFTLPLPPNMANGRGHWRTRDRTRKQYLAQCDEAQLRGLVPPPPPKPLPRALLTAHLTLGGAMDDDNAAARCKHAIDWLVTRGYLVDDRRTCLKWTGFPTQTVSRSMPSGLTLHLDPFGPTEP
jgi:hypothetical protein